MKKLGKGAIGVALLLMLCLTSRCALMAQGPAPLLAADKHYQEKSFALALREYSDAFRAGEF